MWTSHRIIGPSLVALSLVWLAGCGSSGDGEASAAPAQAGSAEPADTTGITAQGVGEVTGVPDILRISMGVETRAEAASDALADNSARTRALIDTLKGAGVADEDLQTSELSVSPTFDEDGREVTGYRVANRLEVTLRDIDRAGEVTDAATFAVGDAIRLQGLRFDIDDTSDLYAEARADAVERADAQATQLAGAAGVDLGPVRSITESPVGGPIPQPARRFAADEAAAAPIEAGSEELSLQVTVVYDLG